MAAPQQLMLSQKPAGGGGGNVDVADNFTRTNANPISNPMSDGVSQWQQTVVGNSVGVMQISGNEASGTESTVNDIARVQSPTFTGNFQKSTVNMPSGGVGGATYTGPCTNIQGAADASCYIMLVNGSATSIQLFKLSNATIGSTTPLGSAFTVTALNPNDAVTMESTYNGSTQTSLVLKINGVAQGSPIVDSTSPLHGGQPGMFCYGTVPLGQAFAASNH